ncbi:NUDIX hydrolase [Aquimarina sp. D1M17]|uniref:NUDIX domain-containing protein n=1 Tax=Aquimarina acroporae TaxID=2937283 RepID=UPI0020C155CC|nr:NUDIX hydrolase [Aquimarina acroporae]MCK8520278.1 NUDIX hydrolase [Aquimarina acroporae]
MKYTVLEETYVYEGYLRIKKGTISHDRFDDNSPVIYDREILDKSGFATVLLYEENTEQIILIKQFRYPTIELDGGWILEIPAGGIENGEDPKECAIREVYEETGYVVEHLELINSSYTSPGISNERMYLYFAEVHEEQKKGKGGGNLLEDEDIEIYKLHISEIRKELQSGIIKDAKTIIALQWFLLCKL